MQYTPIAFGLGLGLGIFGLLFSGTIVLSLIPLYGNNRARSLPNDVEGVYTVDNMTFTYTDNSLTSSMNVTPTTAMIISVEDKLNEAFAPYGLQATIVNATIIPAPSRQTRKK
ncbi:unnamed protein product [Didymodactylos carnosus]|uniref:Uncharacterized protein n=1 Tax=Didymodactylos carnosus TaxID=1234261 RepID=A0A815W071_9BILA|nr:unnamed protein product [Didymodactylos carnosus]CAF4396883.1 unnamed protein product [Didymodactylos carnosus]